MNLENIDKISNLVTNVMHEMSRHWNSDNLSEEQVTHIVMDCDEQLVYHEANPIAQKIMGIINLHNTAYGNQ